MCVAILEKQLPLRDDQAERGRNALHQLALALHQTADLDQVRVVSDFMLTTEKKALEIFLRIVSLLNEWLDLEALHAEYSSPRNHFKSKAAQPVLRWEDVSALLDRMYEIWFDAHADWNTDRTSPSKNAHGMPLAAINGMGYLGNLLNTQWLRVKATNTYTIGTRDTDTEERKAVARSGVHVMRMREIEHAGSLRQLIENIIEEIKSRTAGIPLLIMSYDGDGIHATQFPATGTPVARGGPNRDSTVTAFAALWRRKDVKVLMHDFSEFNPTVHENPATHLEDPDNVQITIDTALAFLSAVYQ